MRLTKKECFARFRSHRARGGAWFYLDDGQLPGDKLGCSFHRDGNKEGVYVKASVLLRALQRTGLLRQWDRKQQVLRKATV